MSWALSAFVMSLLGALFHHANAHFKIPGKQLIVWRGFFPGLALLPLLFFLPTPTSTVFYIVSICSGMLIYLYDRLLFDSSARYGGGVVMRVLSSSIMIVFLTWLVLDGDHRRHMLEHPDKALLSLLCLMLASFFIARLRQCTVTRDAFRFLLPALFAGVAIDTLNKMAAQNASLTAGPVYYTCISGLACGFTALWFLRHERNTLTAALSPTLLRSGMAVGLLVMILSLLKNFAMHTAPNPAYVGAIAMAAPFWLAVYHKVTGTPETADVKSGLAFVLCAIGLVVVNA